MTRLTKFLTKRKILITIGLLLGVGVAFVVLPVSLPLILAFLTTLLLEPFVRSFQKLFKIKRHLSVLIVFIIFICFIAIFGYFITTKVISEVIQIIEKSPMYFNEASKVWFKVEESLVNAARDLPKVVVNQFISQVQLFLYNTRESILAYVNISNVKAILTNIPNYLVSFIIYLVSLFLFLIELPKMTDNLYTHLTEKTAKKVKHMTSRLSFIIFSFIKAQFFISIIIFIISILALYFITPEIAVYMALVIWLIDFIPIFGSLLILIPWALVKFLSGEILIAFLLVLLTIVLVVIKRMIKPKLLGTQFGLSSLATLVVMYLGFNLFGLIGIIVGPLLLIIFYSAKEAGIIQINFKI